MFLQPTIPLSQFRRRSKINQNVLMYNILKLIHPKPEVKKLTESFGSYSTLGARVDHPVIVLEGMDRLQHCGHSADIAVDLRIRQKLRSQVCVEPGLYGSRGVDP